MTDQLAIMPWPVTVVLLCWPFVMMIPALVAWQAWRQSEGGGE